MLANFFGVTGFVFMIAGLLAVSDVSDFLLNLVGITQLHTLPVLSIPNPAWTYMGLGVIFFLVAGTIYNKRVVDFN